MKKTGIAAVTFVWLAATSMASVMVSWGNGATDIVTADIGGWNTTLCSKSSLSQTDYAWSILGANLGVNYYPNYEAEGASPNFYAVTSGDRFVFDDNTVDQLYMRNAYNGSIFLWTQDQFLNGGNSGTVTLSGMSVTSADNGSAVNTTAQFVIRLGTTFYISQKFGEGTRSFSDAASLTWYSYNVANYATIGSAVTLTDFSNLTAAGVYLDGDLTSGTTATYLRDFSVTATVVPEPATIGMLGLGALLTALIRRLKA